MKKVVIGFLLYFGFVLADDPGYWGEPVKLPPIINDTVKYDTLWHRYHAHISPDGTELYYTLNNSPYDDDIYVARYNKETDVWDSVTRLSINKNDSRRELSPSITADHSRLYWVAWNLPGGYGAYDVWYAEWNDSEHDWGEPQNCGPNVNTPGAEFTCFIAPDGKTLYVSSDYDSDCDDIYKHTLQPDSTWGPRERVFEELHPGTCEWDPWVSADGRWIYFSVWSGGYSIWRSHWQGEYFGEPEMLPEPIFVNGDDQRNESPSLNAEGSRLYFSSNRPDSIQQEEFIWYSEYLNYIEEQADSDKYNFEVTQLSKNQTRIKYTLPNSECVFCGVFDTMGSLIRILESETKQGGPYRITWNGLDERGSKVSTGMYFIRLTIGHQQTTKKTIYLK